MRILAVRYSRNIEALERFYETLGLVINDQKSSQVWREMEADDGSVALHPAHPDSKDNLRVELSFETSRKLEDIQGDLEKMGFKPGEIGSEEYGRHLSVEDPDGVLLRINEAALR